MTNLNHTAPIRERLTAILKNHQIKFKTIHHSELIYKYMSDRQKTILKRLMQDYGFRIFLKSLWEYLLRENGKKPKSKLTEYLQENKETEYYDLLESNGIIHVITQYFKTSGKTMRYDIFFSQILGEILEKDLSIPNLIELSPENLKGGGDIDIVALFKDKLIGFEMKTGPPANIGMNEISAFIDRAFLLPDWIHIFFEDTTLRLEDKILPMFEENLFLKLGSNSFIQYPIVQVSDHLFKIPPNIVIANSRPRLLPKLKKIIHLLSP